MDYIVDFGDVFSEPGNVELHQYFLFRRHIPDPYRFLARRVIETSDLDPTVFYWNKNSVDIDKDGCRLTESDKIEMSWIMLQCREWTPAVLS